MVTYPVPERVAYAKASIRAFCNQTHPDKELVIVVDEEPADGLAALGEYIRSLGRSDIRIVLCPRNLILGKKRNLSLDSARGDVLCQWDDDDLFHPQRLECQLACLREGDHEAVYLQEVMQYFPRAQSIYWTNWQSTQAGGHPGSLMVKRVVPFRYPIEGPTASLGEDLHVALLLRERGSVQFLATMPHLFVYVSHGNNSWNASHHEMLASELSISKGLLQRREAAVRQGLKPFDFGTHQLSVQGKNGLAFVI
jgi:glycosyltransferase involved in cell wall biosynthesis